MSPFETYQAYLGIKNHFSNPKYDYFKYKKTRATLTSFNKRKDRYFFEKTSRKYNDKEIVNFLVSNFVATDNPQSIWIGQIINSGAASCISLARSRSNNHVELISITDPTASCSCALRSSMSLINCSTRPAFHA